MPRPGSKKPADVSRRKTGKLDRRIDFVDLYLKGWTQQKIAEKWGVTQSLVSQEIKAAVEVWKAEMVEAVDTIKSKEVNRILALERVYWEQFEQSCKKLIYPKDKQGIPDFKKKPKEVSQLGDPTLLAGIKSCIELRCKVLGLFKDVTNHNVNLFSFDRMVEEIKKAQGEINGALVEITENGPANPASPAPTSEPFRPPLLDRLAEVERIQVEMERKVNPPLPPSEDRLEG